MQRYNKLKVSQGFSIIELIVVILIIGSLMTLGLKLLKTLWLKQSNGITSLEFIQVVNLARQKSLADGQILTLLLNEDKKTMELSLFNPEKEHLLPDYEFQKKSTKNLKDDSKSNDALFRSNLPPEIEDFYSTSGIKLTTPLIFIHFYPDGTSDSIIVKYKDRKKPYYFIPRNGGNGAFLSEINNLSYEN